MSNAGTNQLSTTGADLDVTTFGRVLYAVPFLVFGIMHFLQGGAMAGAVRAPAIPL